MQLRFYELSKRQQDQARARFIDAGTVKDQYWYELDPCGNILCRNPVHDDTGDFYIPDEERDGVIE